MAYEAFRKNGEPTYYDANPTPWQADILESGFIFAFVILAFSFYVILPGIRGKEVNSLTLITETMIDKGVKTNVYYL